MVDSAVQSFLLSCGSAAPLLVPVLRLHHNANKHGSLLSVLLFVHPQLEPLRVSPGLLDSQEKQDTANQQE